MADRSLSEGYNEQIKRDIREGLSRARTNVGRTGRWHKKGGGSSTHQMGFVITEEDCAAGTVTTTPASIARFTGCGEPPGINDDDEYVIQDYYEILASLEEEYQGELVGMKAMAIYWYDYPNCTGRWDLVMVEWDGGC